VVEIIAVLFTVCVLPLAIIMHYVTKWKATKGLSEQEERLLEQLWQDSQRMQSRLNALETILDEKTPDWRKQV
jgi:phage shock protein B